MPAVPAVSAEPAHERHIVKRLRSGKAFNVATLHNGVLGIACAEFAAGEKVRMTIWQDPRKPWDFVKWRRYLGELIGNERGRKTPAHAAELARLQRVVERARALAARPGTAGESAAAKQALKRIEKAETILAAKQTMESVFNAMDVYIRRYPAASDFVDFYIEYEGRRLGPTETLAQNPRRSLQARERPAPVSSPGRSRSPASTPVPADRAAQLLAKVEAELGTAAVEAFLGALGEFIASPGKVRAFQSGGTRAYHYRIHVHHKERRKHEPL